MGLLTIGAFARRAGLTAKALRLYDELALLPPAAVDPDTGYRFYAAEQVHEARLIAQLRRIGMPLSEIRTVRALDPAAQAEAITAFWRQVTADTAHRARLATFLVDHLTGRATTMSEPHVRYAAACVTGAVRKIKQDCAYADEQLFAVADGGGGDRGAEASTTAVEALKQLTRANVPPVELLTMLAAAVTDAGRTIRAQATADQQPISTLTALLRRGSRLALVHIGDTRAYLLRGAELTPLTQDHTWVQTQIDAGNLDRTRAATHPQRALLVRALGAAGDEVEADLALRTALPGDRYLLCSDGLSTVVDREALQAALTDPGPPDETVQRLLDLAHAAGAPDNIACVVADFE